MKVTDSNPTAKLDLQSILDRRIPGGRGVHLLSILTLTVSLILIFVGGLVTSKQAGMSVPDWPNSYGYNMFLFPPRLWTGGIFYEHSHRLLGTVVGFLAILTAVAALFTESRPAVRKLSYAVLLLVIIQGVLGGLRVVLVKLGLAIVHGCFAQACFCVMALLCVVTSKQWFLMRDNSQPIQSQTHLLVKLGIVAVATIYMQLIAGAVMRHNNAGLAVTDIPWIYGKFLPPSTDEELKPINLKRAFAELPAMSTDSALRSDQATMRVTRTQIWYHFIHRVGALLVTVVVFSLIIAVLITKQPSVLKTPAYFLLVLVIAQVTLGILTVLYKKPADIASMHVAVGALTLMTTFVLTVRAVRVYGPACSITKSTDVSSGLSEKIAGLKTSAIGTL